MAGTGRKSSRRWTQPGGRNRLPPAAARCKRKFLHYFPGGFRDPTYLEWERDYKWETHERWNEALGQQEIERLVRGGEFAEVARRAVQVEQRSRHSMLFSFEKMALRDAVKTAAGAETFAAGLVDYLHGPAELPARFDAWVEAISRLPRRQTRVLTWPLATVFGFIAQPERHIFVKPNVTRAAAVKYGFDLQYSSRVSWDVYARCLELAETVRREMKDLRPRDMIDAQSFLWVQGSEEYPD
jgi:hypothetical protein